MPGSSLDGAQQKRTLLDELVGLIFRDLLVNQLIMEKGPEDGFDRTPLPHFKTLPQFVRNTPDYVATRGRDEEGFLVECKAGGTDSTSTSKT